MALKQIFDISGNALIHSLVGGGVTNIRLEARLGTDTAGTAAPTRTLNWGTGER